MTIQQIIDLFKEVDPADRLEVLIDFGNQLDGLAPEFKAMRDAGLYIVHECQAPVFFMARTKDGVIAVEADVPVDAPIARGFVALLKSVFDQQPASLLSALPENMLTALGIEEALGLQRRRGLGAIYQVLKGIESG